MKKLLTVLLCVAFLCMGMVVTTAAEEAEALKLPWIDEGVKVEIVMNFDDMADAAITAETWWCGGNWPVQAEIRGGQLVYTSVMMDTFWFVHGTAQMQAKAEAGNIVKAEGYGVYIKNASSFDFAYGPYVELGGVVSAKYTDVNSPAYLYYMDGTVSKAEVVNDSWNAAVVVPAGFEGYVITPITSLNGAPGVAVNSWGMIFNGAMNMFVDGGEEVIVDNVFIYGTEVADEPGTLTYTPGTVDLENVITPDAPVEPPVTDAPTEEAPAPTEEAPTPTEEAPAPTEEAPTPTEEAPTPTEETPSENEEAGFPWLIVVIAAVAVAVIAAVVVIIIKKKGANKDAE